MMPHEWRALRIFMGCILATLAALVSLFILAFIGGGHEQRNRQAQTDRILEKIQRVQSQVDLIEDHNRGMIREGARITEEQGALREALRRLEARKK